MNVSRAANSPISLDFDASESPIYSIVGVTERDRAAYVLAVGAAWSF